MRLLLRVVMRYSVFVVFGLLYGLVGAAVSIMYPEKLVAGFAAGSTVFFIQVVVSHLYHWDEVVKELGE